MLNWMSVNSYDCNWCRPFMVDLVDVLVQARVMSQSEKIVSARSDIHSQQTRERTNRNARSKFYFVRSLV